jgi:EGF-like domain
MQLRLGLLCVSGSLVTACFDPLAPPLDSATDGSSGGTTMGAETSAGPGPDDTVSDPTMGQDSTGFDSLCDPNPCENMGECVLGGSGFTCVCPPGFMGDLCEVDEDPCDPNPCENGTCGMEGAMVVCYCEPGFEGEECEDEIDECDDMPCQNDGVCTDELAGFSCECPSGFEGDACEVNIDDCVGTPCQNGGMCIDGVEAFECECGAGFEGPLCQCELFPPTQIDYTNDGTFTAPMLYDDPPGVRVTGSNLINVLNLNGLGIVGGVNNNTIDGNEFIDFEFDHASASTQYFVPSAGNQDMDGFVGEAFLEAFDEAGASLGTVAVNDAGVFDLGMLFPGAGRITRFRVTADVDNLRIGSVTVSPVVCM